MKGITVDNVREARETLIGLRDEALQAANMDSAVLLTQTIALFHELISVAEKVEVPA